MIIGTKFDYCLSDLMLKTIDIDDVFVVVADSQINLNNTDSLTAWWDRQMDPMTQYYSRGKNSLHLFTFEDCYMKIQTMTEDGKLATRTDMLPSKMIDTITRSRGEHWFELQLRREDMDPAVELAWNHYQMLSGLCK